MKHVLSAFENTILHINSKVYGVQNTAIGQTKHLQQTYQRCDFFIGVRQYVNRM